MRSHPAYAQKAGSSITSFRLMTFKRSNGASTTPTRPLKHGTGACADGLEGVPKPGWTFVSLERNGALCAFMRNCWQGSLVGRNDLTLILETPLGVVLHRIPTASPLRPDLLQGTAAEEATQDAAALWGLPDFVFHAQVLSGTQASREIGDRLVIVGDLGLVGANAGW